MIDLCTNRNSFCCAKLFVSSVITIQIRFYLTKFRIDFTVCMYNCMYIYTQPIYAYIFLGVEKRYILILNTYILLDPKFMHTSFYTEKTIFPFPFPLNGIWSWWQFSFRFWTKWNSIWLKIEWKTVTTIISHSMWKEMEI